MKVVILVIVGIIILLCIVPEVIACIVAYGERKRVKGMSPEEQRKYQEQMYKKQSFDSGL